ncbi:hypothetical protein MUN82_03985 [Hymenobacter aerilatus]|uniref:Cupin domain-containing protein n=1 Tax=Hymenobacter aerilatus TaxID=2932251 RepID=A0A8T9T2P5_9BACT|nr:hypothetical protein [Hymenobacter aerilatus]UOR06259.1 hypothetical protein MUN82_03985 [Hymenobacter aerilatus]
MNKKIIYGCEARGDADSPYLTRYTLLSTRWFQLCVHVFHRSDADDLHDHPWNFWTLPLRHGYKEEYATTPGQPHATRIRECKVGRLYYRPARHTHRVILHNKWQDEPSQQEYMPGKFAMGKRLKPAEAITLVLMTKRRREWGFYVKGVWQYWIHYFDAKGC